MFRLEWLLRWGRSKTPRDVEMLSFDALCDKSLAQFPLISLEANSAVGE